MGIQGAKEWTPDEHHLKENPGSQWSINAGRAKEWTPDEHHLKENSLGAREWTLDEQHLKENPGTPNP